MLVRFNLIHCDAGDGILSWVNPTLAGVVKSLLSLFESVLLVSAFDSVLLVSAFSEPLLRLLGLEFITILEISLESDESTDLFSLTISVLIELVLVSLTRVLVLEDWGDVMCVCDDGDFPSFNTFLSGLIASGGGFSLSPEAGRLNVVIKPDSGSDGLKY